MYDDLLPRLLAEILRHSWKADRRAPDHAVVGKTVRVTDRIPPGKVGAVLVPIRGGTEEFYARSAARATIPAGQMVRVVDYAPPRTVDVEPIPDVSLSKHTTPEL